MALVATAQSSDERDGYLEMYWTVATALIGLLAWEPPYAASVALKDKKPKKKERESHPSLLQLSGLQSAVRGRLGEGADRRCFFTFPLCTAPSTSVCFLAEEECQDPVSLKAALMTLRTLI